MKHSTCGICHDTWYDSVFIQVIQEFTKCGFPYVRVRKSVIGKQKQKQKHYYILGVLSYSELLNR